MTEVETTTESTREGEVALALSGGGFRASLFHLGALRRLNELGVLSRVDAISSVSGGSILSAFLADRVKPWPLAGESFSDWEVRVRLPVWEFASRNIRTWPLLRRALPWNWLRGSAVESLANRYRRDVNGSSLPDLPSHPHFIFCATDLSFGANWTFERETMGDYQVGRASSSKDFMVGRAVAASSCFPPIFAPMKLPLNPADFGGGRFPAGQDRVQILSNMRLSDGGVYDNMGLEPVWKKYKTVLVSDGGAVFDAGPDKGLLWQLMRYSTILGVQASAIRKRWLISSFEEKRLRGTYWGVGSAPQRYGDFEGYSKDLARRFIAEIRTDLDAFSVAEKAILENHGYLLAEAAVRRWMPELISSDILLNVPNPDWMDEEKVKEALSRSHKQKIPFGRW